MSAYLGVHTGEVVALGWTLLHFCWQSAGIALLYALVDRCTRNASASVRNGIAVTALALMPLAAIATFVEQERLVVPVQHTVQPSTQVEQQLPVIASRLGTMHTAILNEVPSAAPIVSGGELWIAEHAGVLLPCMDVLWLLGVLLLTVRAAGGWWQLRGLKLRASAAVPPEIQIAFERLKRRYELSRGVLLRMSDEVISPMVFGVWRTVVLVPMSAVAQLTPEQMEAVLAHELAHVRRWDYLVNLMQTVTECLFFFHPAVWWISHRVRDFREVCCDEAATQTCADPAIYAAALLQMEEQRFRQPQLAMALNGNGGTLLQRVRQVMGEKAMEQRQMSGIRMMTAGLALVGLYAVPHVAHSMKMEITPKPAVAPLAEVAPRVTAQPTPEVVIAVKPKVDVATVQSTNIDIADANPELNPAPAPRAVNESSSQEVKQNGMQYLDGMKAAGYPLDLNNDLDEIIRLRSIGVTPEYASAMSQAGMGKPTLKELTTLKAVGVTPDYVKSLKSSSSAPANFRDVISFKTLGVTPEYAQQMESLGLGKPTMHDLTSMKAVGVTPEYAAGLKSAGFTPKDFHELVSMRAVGVTPEYASAMAAAGFSANSSHDLVSMKAQGMTPEYAKWLKANFPNADLHAMRQAITFHIDEKFVADAKAHGFNGTDLDKLTKLKMSGLLN
ncbi:M56 family metallopeptidase [Terriglobus roseus]|uniref:BlaR1 peptidase M56 n=1 Tax=Terriglobus roseus TaxID=392734 RepID=A0A1G7L822_9BACT|nr:M56 family metallopeptidase [Terriglobus roseus]SDF45169.1 BlaR1 peptidase M56 [Terriglobus roseus]